MKPFALVVLLVSSVAPTALGAASPADRPTAVSPGGAETFLAAQSCPTFSWTAPSPTASYRLQVYEVGALSQEKSAPALEAVLPAGASSWSPPADACLAPGRYAWTVRTEQTTEQVGEKQRRP